MDGIYQFPVADNPTVIAVIAFVLALLFGAFGLDIYRRKRDRRLRIDAEWRAVKQIVAERELSEREAESLTALIRTHAAQDPYHAATMKYRFDECVDADMCAVRDREGEEAFAKRGVHLRDIRTRLGLDFVAVGQRIESTREVYVSQIVWAARESEAKNAGWSTLVVAAVDEAYFHLAPAPDAPAPGFRVGERIRVRMWREEDARYVFMSTVARVDIGPQVWVCEHTTELNRTQSRAHFRIRHDQSTDIGIVNGPIDGNMEGVEARPVVTRIRGRITSLSGGGFAVVSPQPVPTQVLLRATLELEASQGYVTVTAKLVGSSPLSNGRHLLRGAFVGISDEARERITHYVFKRQQHNVQAAHPYGLEEG